MIVEDLMISLTNNNPCMRDEMIQKLFNDPDKFERMFAARYLCKYNFSECKLILKDALQDEDPEVAVCVARLLEVRD
ncbi:MAG: HEAT repeat domain-containing protein [Promethearchaeota archaeon]|jgi:hypothetical protein